MILSALCVRCRMLFSWAILRMRQMIPVTIKHLVQLNKPHTALMGSTTTCTFWYSLSWSFQSFTPSNRVCG